MRMARIAQITIMKGHTNFAARIQMYDRCNRICKYNLERPSKESACIRKSEYANYCESTNPKADTTIDLPSKYTSQLGLWRLSAKSSPFRVKKEEISTVDEQKETTGKTVNLRENRKIGPQSRWSQRSNRAQHEK